MSEKQRTYGQYETPPDVADIIVSFCLRQPGDYVLDPSCGTGAMLLRAAQMKAWSAAGETPADWLWGIELDPEAAATAQASLPQAHIVNRSFFDLQPWPDRPFDALVGNPPYTRSEWIGRLAEREQSARQLSIFNGPASKPVADQSHKDVGQHRVLDKRAGLHAHFFVHGTQFLREGGRFGFVVPNSWLDVAYGERLKQYLLDHYKILAIIESSVERWFNLAKVNTCIVVLEKCSDAAERLENRVRLIRLRRPLQELIAYAGEDRRRATRLDKLIARMQPKRTRDSEDMSARVVRQHKLDAEDKWGIRLRAPAVIRRRAWKANLHPLKSWAIVQRGFTTGANDFFYLDEATIEEWQIEPEFRRPILKALRHVNHRRVNVGDCELEVLQIEPTANLTGTSTGAYVAWGEEQGWHRRRTCASRKPWYSLPEQEEAPLLLAKGIWERHFAPLLEGPILVDQQLYHVYLAQGVPEMAAAALLNSAWFSLQMELYGRVNFGEGLLWLAAYELEGLLLPDPRYLPDEQVTNLVDSFLGLIDRPVGTVYEEMAWPAWQAFNAIVFEILGLSPSDGDGVTEALLESVATRRIKAGKGV
jgi:hypothetical protein